MTLNNVKKNNENEKTKTANKSKKNRKGGDDTQMNLADMKELTIAELTKMAKELNINGYSSLKKQELIFRILQANITTRG